MFCEYDWRARSGKSRASSSSVCSHSSARPRIVACAGKRVPTFTLLVNIDWLPARSTTTTSRPSRITSCVEKPASSRSRSSTGRASSVISSEAMYSKPSRITAGPMR